MYSVCYSLCYYITLHVISMSECMLLFHVTRILCVSIAGIQRIRVYANVPHHKYSACEIVCYCFTLQALSVSECMSLFPNTCIERIRVFITVFHYNHSACQSVCYCFLLQALSVSVCIINYCFTLQVLYLSECMLLFHITCIVLVRVYVTVSHYRHLVCQSVC